MPPSINRMRKRFIIEAPSDVPDGAGGVIRTWVEAGAVWASIEAIGGDFRFAAERAAQTITHRLSMRWRDDLSPLHKLRDGTRVYEIRSVHDADMERRFLVALTSEIKT
jgi:SPP1 family predicted phage head-tail adaptor